MLRDASPGDNDIPIRNLNYDFPDNSMMSATTIAPGNLAQANAQITVIWYELDLPNG
ncbi:MAG: hypothetical protein GX750_02025 [Clostridia bacterium]|nr:hypothetical protein [Clostridia bacterium]